MWANKVDENTRIALLTGHRVVAAVVLRGARAIKYGARLQLLAKLVVKKMATKQICKRIGNNRSVIACQLIGLLWMYAGS